MDTETVMQELNRRFAAPLPEFYRRRIVFWYDEEREFEGQLDELSLPGVKLVRLTGSNTFAVKKLLTVDDTTSNFLVYRPFGFDSLEEDWLIDVELYSEEFRADLLSIWMDEMHIASTPALRKTAKDYRRFFAARDRRAKVAALAGGAAIFSPSALHLAVMGALCGSAADPGAILRAVLSAGTRPDNTFLRDLAGYGADKPFWAMVSQGCGYREEAPALDRLAAHMLLTAATKTMPVGCLDGLEALLSLPHQSYCYDLISDWLHSGDCPALRRIALDVEDALQLPRRFDSLRLEELADTECFPCIHVCILKKLMGDVANHLIDVEAITSLAEKRRTSVWYDTVQHYFEGLLQLANMQAFYREHSAGFHAASPGEAWREYTDTYYRMDTYYRLFHLSFIRSLNASNPELDDLFKQSAEAAESLYKQWFLGELGRNWMAVCADDLAEQGGVTGVDRQTGFYSKYVKTAESRIFVIISDAMRYEVAASLCEQLRRETQAQVGLSSVQGIFPTTTKFGMAALLPHRELSVLLKNGKLSVLADGSLTESGYRERILKSAEPDSAALKYDDVIKAKRAERSEWVRGKNVVYIYHDVIDEASHTADTAVFPACEEAIQQIKNLVRINLQVEF